MARDARSKTKSSMMRRKSFPKEAPKQAPTAQISPEDKKKIEVEAYSLFEKRGRRHGNDWSDWLEAERIVKSRSG